MTARLLWWVLLHVVWLVLLIVWWLIVRLVLLIIRLVVLLVAVLLIAVLLIAVLLLAVRLVAVLLIAVAGTVLSEVVWPEALSVVLSGLEALLQGDRIEEVAVQHVELAELASIVAWARRSVTSS